MQDVEMQYSPSYVQSQLRQPSMPQQPPQSQYQSYGQGMMLPSAQPQPIYDPMSPYQQRQSAAAAEVMASQFAVPQYLPSGESGNIAHPAPYVGSQSETSSFRPQLPSTRGLQQSYAAPSAAYGQVEEQQTVRAGPTEPAQDVLEASIRQYQDELKATFGAIRAERVTEASAKLLDLARWLLGNVPVLGEYKVLETPVCL